MKKTFLFIVAFAAAFFVFSVAQAQKGLHLGVRLAPQATFLNNQNDMDEGPELNPQVKMGFMGGIGVGYHFIDFLGVEVDVLYSGQGFRAVAEEDGVDYSQPGNVNLRLNRNLSYLKIPVLLKLNTSSEARVMGSFFLGPQFSFLTGASSTFDIYKGSMPTGLTIDDATKLYYLEYFGGTEDITKDLYKPMSIDVVLGLGIDIKVTDNIFINANVRIDYGLTDAENKEKDHWKTKYYATKYSSGGETTLKYKDSQGKEPWIGQDPYQYYSKSGNTYVQKGDLRSATANATVGFQIGATYVLPFD